MANMKTKEYYKEIYMEARKKRGKRIEIYSSKK